MFWIVQFFSVYQLNTDKTRQILMSGVNSYSFWLCVWNSISQPSWWDCGLYWRLILVFNVYEDWDWEPILPYIQHSFIYPLIPREEYGLEIEHFITFPFKDQSKGCLRPYLQRDKHIHNSSLCASGTRSENHKQHQGLLTSSHMGIVRKQPFVDKWPKDICMCQRIIHFFQHHVCLINTHRTSWPHPANKCER